MLTTSVPSRIGVVPVGRMAYELTNGSMREYEFGLARIEFMGEVTAGRVLFGPDDVEPLLGVTAVSSVGITFDPVSETLSRLPVIPGSKGSRSAGAISPRTSTSSITTSSRRSTSMQGR